MVSYWSIYHANVFEYLQYRNSVMSQTSAYADPGNFRISGYPQYWNSGIFGWLRYVYIGTFATFQCLAAVKCTIIEWWVIDIFGCLNIRMLQHSDIYYIAIYQFQCIDIFTIFGCWHIGTCEYCKCLDICMSQWLDIWYIRTMQHW